LFDKYLGLQKLKVYSLSLVTY